MAQEQPANRKKRRKDKGAAKSGRTKRHMYTNVAIPRHLQPWTAEANNR